MTISSFQARLIRINPRFRIRRRTGWKLYDGAFIKPAGIYIGSKHICRIECKDLSMSSKPIIRHKFWNPVAKQWMQKIVSRQERGRREAVMFLINSKKTLRMPRWARQLLML